MSVSPYLQFSGNCAEALAFYESGLGATVTFRITHGETPMPATPGWEDKIMHASFTVLGSTIMGSDAPAGMYHKPAGFRVSVSPATPEQAQTFFDALAAGGTIDMPLQKTFWAKAFGMVTDKFSIPWMINCE
jgi:PhnB protein